MIIIVKHKQKRERKLVTYCYLPLNKMCTVSPRESTRYPAAVIKYYLGLGPPPTSKESAVDKTWEGATLPLPGM